ncbi:MAG TPA: recombination protein O N-terminal domain-containing protein [Novosphingobium sp.]|mgnify:CR=1 FL=1|nr:recombination protein O N-terminal domain-containing protein [Novosphingobium sp.]HMP55848.1 recombination protein O N-terminal domain-containing protein [Novosphingobium sp.]
MQLRARAIVCAARPQGETAVVARLLTEHHGLIAAYVAGGRGRTLRPVLVPGNLVQADLHSRSDTMLPFATLELVASRGPWLGEPLCAAAIDWATALTATALPERHAYPPLFAALSALLDALCHAPSARGWVPGLLAYEALVLRELGYGDRLARPAGDDWGAIMAAFDRSGAALARWVLAERRERAMAARDRLRQRLERIEGQELP